MNRLYSLAQTFVDKYNAEYNCNLGIQRHSESGFSLPYIYSDTIYIDKSVHVWLSLYSFGNPNLFIYYRLMKGMLYFNVFFLEYANRINKLFFTPINENKKERVKQNLIVTIVDSVNSRIRAIYQDFHINNFFAAENIDDDSRMLYSTLAGVPLSNFNESLDVEFIKSLQPFQDLLCEGCQIEFDENKLSFIRQEVNAFENAIIYSILNELDKKSASIIY